MKVIRSGAVLVIIAALAITGTVIIKQNTRIRGLRKSQRNLAAKYKGLSVTNASLLSVEAAQNDELSRLRKPSSEVLQLRSQVTQAWEQLAAERATNRALAADSTNDFAGSMTREQLSFVGFDTPENAFESLNWAVRSGDYTNWLAALSPAAQQEELADTGSLERFNSGTNSPITRMQVLSSKPVGSDRVELKVRWDTENARVIMIYPMVAVGNEWRLDGDIEPYTRAWDSPGGAQ